MRMRRINCTIYCGCIFTLEKFLNKWFNLKVICLLLMFGFGLLSVTLFSVRDICNLYNYLKLDLKLYSK